MSGFYTFLTFLLPPRLRAHGSPLSARNNHPGRSNIIPGRSQKRLKTPINQGIPAIRTSGQKRRLRTLGRLLGAKPSERLETPVLSPLRSPFSPENPKRDLSGPFLGRRPSPVEVSVRSVTSGVTQGCSTGVHAVQCMDGRLPGPVYTREACGEVYQGGVPGRLGGTLLGIKQAKNPQEGTFWHKTGLNLPQGGTFWHKTGLKPPQGGLFRG